MNRSQKIALYNLVIMGVSFTCVVLSFFLFWPRIGAVKAGHVSFGFLGICGLMGFAPILFKKPKGGIEFDERDKEINRKAALAGYAFSYGVVGIFCMGTFLVVGPKGVVSVTLLPMAFMLGGIGLWLGGSVAILFLYRKQGG